MLQSLRDLITHGLDDAEIGAALGVSANAVHIAQVRHHLPSRTDAMLSSREVAKRMGVKCAKTAVRWIEAGWLRGWRGQRRGANRQWYVRPAALFDFVRDRRHWHRWDPERIADDELRRYALAVRGGERFLTVGEVAERMYCQTGTVNQWIRRGWLPAARHQNWMIREADLNRFALPPFGGRPKPRWDPCAVCGDPDGRIGKGNITPMRFNGGPYGIVGTLCYRCYRRCYRAQRKAIGDAGEERLAA